MNSFGLMKTNKPVYKAHPDVYWTVNLLDALHVG